MKQFVWLWCVAVLAVVQPAKAEDFPPLESIQKLRLREAFRLAEQLGPKVWPAFTGSGAPVLLLTGETEYLLNQDVAPGGFQAVPGGEFNGKPVFARAPVFPAHLRATFPAIGKESVVIGTAEQTGLSPTAWAIIVAHELFHVFQAAHGLNEKIAALEIGPPGESDWHLNFPFPYEDGDIQHAMHLLGYALYRTVTLPADAGSQRTEYDARTCFEALANLLTVLELRYRDPRQGNYLRYQTMKEGVARYVEYQLAREAARDYEPLAAFVAAPGFVPYAELWEKKYKDQLFLIKHAGRVARTRVEFYALGHGLALVLDRIDPAWKKNYFEPGVWLDDLLRSALAIPGPAPTT